MVSCIKLLKRVIKECDFFGTLITFQINNDYDYKSLIGGISTIIYSIIAGAYILYMSLRFILRKEVNFIYSNKILDSGPFVNLYETGFNIAFGVRYSNNGKPANEDTKKYLNYNFYSIVWVHDSDKQYTPIGIKNCNVDDFPKVVEESFYENSIDSMLCPVLNSSMNFSIDGLYTDYYYKYFIIETRMTEYAMNHYDEFTRFIEKTPIEAMIYFMDSAIDYSHRSNYLPQYINYLYKEIDIDFEKKTQVFISSIEFSNDENIIISNPSMKIDSMYDNSVDSFKFFHNRVAIGQSLLQKFVVKASPKIIQLNRVYQKLPSFIADLTGLLQNVLELLLIFINIIERKAVDRKLIQKMLKYKGSKYYDVEYMNSIFHIDEMDNNIKNLINKEKLTISRNGNITTQRKSIANLLLERKFVVTPTITRNRVNRNTIRELTYRVFNEFNNINKSEAKSDNNSNNNSNNNNSNNNSKEMKSIKEEDENEINSSRNLKEEPILKLHENSSNNSSSNNNENEKNEKKSESLFNESLSYKSNKEQKNFHTFVHNNFFPKQNQEINLIKIKNKEFERTNDNFNNNKNNINNNEIDNNYETKQTLENDKIITTSDEKNEVNNLYKNKIECKTLLLNKDDDENLGKFSTFDVLIASYCNCCSRKQRRRNLMLKKCEFKIHYYLDIYTYIKKMQEIDLIKYCLFDENQLKLFKYLSTPPVKLSEKNIGIYKEFEEQQVNYSNIGKNEIDKLVDSYINMAKKKDITFEDIKLLRLVNAEVDYLD